MPGRRRRRRDRNPDRAARPRHRRLRGAARPARAEAADGRAVHLLRPGGPGRIRHRARRRRAAASPHRPGDRDLPLSRRVPAPRQPRLEPDHPSRRAELDGRGTRRHPFRAHQRRDAPRAAQPVRHPDLGRLARGAGGRRAELRAPRQGGAADARSRRRAAKADPRKRLRRARARQRVLGDVLRRRRARARARACRCRTITRTAGSTSSKARSTVAGQTFEAGRMLVFRPWRPDHDRRRRTGARLLLLGGATLGGPRYIWWNFVASSRETDRRGARGMAQGGLGQRPVRPAARRSRRIHPGALTGHPPRTYGFGRCATSGRTAANRSGLLWRPRQRVRGMQRS